MRYLQYLLSSRLLMAVVLLFAVLGCYPMLQNGWVNWDDPAYVLENALLTIHSWGDIQALFSTLQVQGMYHPLTLLSLAFDKWAGGFNPQIYHTHNLLLHLANVLLVFRLTQLLNFRNAMAGFVALVFAVHPMHVESVAWVSERKDVLYAFYFLLALIAWLTYLRSQQRKALLYAASLLFFSLSLLAKTMAITLPVLLLLVDWFTQRTNWKRTLLEKLPFFALSIAFGLIAIKSQQAGSAMGNLTDLKLYQTVFVACYGLVLYVAKLFIPAQLSAFHPYPYDAAGALPWYVYAAAIPVLLATALLLWKGRKHRLLLFGALFFLVSIGPVLQVISVGKAIIAERFTYLPYIGLTLLVGTAFQQLWQRQSQTVRYALAGIAVCWLAALLVVCNLQSRKWHSNETLWTQVISVYPAHHLAYCNRATTRGQAGALQQALADCNRCIALEPTLFESLNNRALLHQELGNVDAALQDYAAALALNPKYQTGLSNRAALYIELQQYRAALADLQQLVQLNPNNAGTYYNLALAHSNLGQYQPALEYAGTAIRLAPETGAFYALRSHIHRQLGHESAASRNAWQAGAINENSP